MTKAYDFESPLVTERTLEHTAEVIKSKFAQKEEVKAVSDKVGEVDLTSLQEKVTTLENNEQQILDVLNKWV